MGAAANTAAHSLSVTDVHAAREHSVQRSLITEDGAVIGERLFCLVGPASQRPDNLQSKCQVGKRQTWPGGSRADRDEGAG